MKITDIEIERFGVWRDLQLPLTNSGVSVFYGPNEAGKTTLMRFIRSMLFGFESPDTRFGESRLSSHGWQGTLKADHQGRQLQIERSSHTSGRGTVTVKTGGSKQFGDELLQELLQGVDEKLFNHVFAIGLQELQALATLHDDEVAHHIYGMTLGPEGQRLLEVTRQIESERGRLLDPQHNTGELAELFDHYDLLSAEVESLQGGRERHAELSRERTRGEATNDELKSRQQGLESQLRGHVFMERVWTPWNRVRKIDQELKQLPFVSGFPEDGSVRLDLIESELGTAVNCRDTLLAEAKRFRKDAAGLGMDPEIRKHAASIQSFVDQAEWIQTLQQRVDKSTAEAEELRRELDVNVESLGADWSTSRLEAVDTTPAAHLRMVAMARTYQSALARRAKLRRRHQRLSKSCQQRLARLNEQQEQLGGASLDEAMAVCQQTLADLGDLGRLKLRESELEQRRIGLSDQLQRLESRVTLPKWVYAVLIFFGVTGVILGLLGIMTGLTTNGIAGAIYALLGATCGGLAWALKTHFEHEVGENIERVCDELRENESRLREARAAVDRLSTANTMPFTPATATVTCMLPPGGIVSEPASVAPTSDLAINRLSEAELIKLVTHRMGEFESMAGKHERIQKLRRRLSDYRARFQGVQRKVATVRQNWCELLTQLGFAETVRIDEAFRTWQRVVEANELRRLWSTAETDRQNHQQSLQSYRQRIEELGHRMHCWDLDYDQPLDVLVAWEDTLKEYAEHRRERRQLRRKYKTRRSEAADYQTEIDELKMQRAAILVQGGATTRDEFDARAGYAGRRRELEQQLAQAKAELQTVARTEPELAVVEDDLLAYDSDKNSTCIHTLKQELDDLENDLHQSFENLGRVKQEIAVLEDYHRSSSLRLEREQVVTQLQDAAEQWFAIELAGQSVEQIREKFERTCQPAMLASASRHLTRLSCSKYRNIWTPLGQRTLRVDDDHDNALPVEFLSGGTREQLFLAIRLAMVREFAQSGIELPMVLDDVVVNFDQLRTEAAVDELLEVAQQGQQILFFTCHLHLAHMFESKGINPVWLPRHHPSIEERRAG